MAQQKNTWTVILVIIVLFVIAGGIYWWQTIQKDQEPLTSPEVEVTETETSYSPSEELNETLDLALDELRMSLFRGDAELAPTYEEFITNVNKAQDTLEEVVGLYKEESKGKNIPEELANIFNSFESINDELRMSLLRGDAELAPTYEEFTENVRNISEEFSTYIEEYKKLN